METLLWSVSGTLPQTHSQRDLNCEFVSGLLLPPQSGDFSFGTRNLRAGNNSVKMSGMTTSPSMTSFDKINKEYRREKNKQGPREIAPPLHFSLISHLDMPSNTLER